MGLDLSPALPTSVQFANSAAGRALTEIVAEAATQSALDALIARVAALESGNGGRLAFATTVTAITTLPAPRITGMIPGAVVHGVVAMPAPVVRGSATRTAVTLSAAVTIPAPTVTVP